MFYIIYKVTNLVNNKYYIGKHQTTNLDDGYMGSGKLLKSAIKKYGIENFKKEILCMCSSEQEMNDKERELVVLNENTYNLCPGGQGGFGYINQNISAEQKQIYKAKAIFLDKIHNESEFRDKFLASVRKRSDDLEYRNNLSKGVSASYQDRDGPWKGKNHSLETIHKMENSHIGKHSGRKNSQFGTMWITNGYCSKKVNKNDTVPEGWYKGRVINRA